MPYYMYFLLILHYKFKFIEPDDNVFPHIRHTLARHCRHPRRRGEDIHAHHIPLFPARLPHGASELGMHPGQPRHHVLRQQRRHTRLRRLLLAHRQAAQPRHRASTACRRREGICRRLHRLRLLPARLHRHTALPLSVAEELQDARRRSVEHSEGRAGKHLVPVVLVLLLLRRFPRARIL